MKITRTYIYIISLCIIIGISGCNKSTDGLEDSNELQSALDTQKELVKQLQSENDTLKQTINNLEEQNQQIPLSPNSSFVNTVLATIHLLAKEDISSLSEFVHPSNGVRFSPYGFVDVSNDLVFTAPQVSTLMQDQQKYTWGNYDGSGEPITKTFPEYYTEFVYDADFENPHMIGNNVVVGTGNTINNISEVYPNGIFVEFHFTGLDPQYDGMDWVSLRLVYENVDGIWYLVGIVHDQWTV